MEIATIAPHLLWLAQRIDSKSGYSLSESDSCSVNSIIQLKPRRNPDEMKTFSFLLGGHGRHAQAGIWSSHRRGCRRSCCGGLRGRCHHIVAGRGQEPRRAVPCEDPLLGQHVNRNPMYPSMRLSTPLSVCLPTFLSVQEEEDDEDVVTGGRC